MYSYLLTGISGFSTFSNFKSFAYIRKTFDTTNNLFNILAKDSLVSAIGSGIYCTTNIIKLWDEDLLTSDLGCVAHFIGLYLPTMLGSVSSLLISVRRFIQLKYPNAIGHNSQKANLMMNAILILMGIYYQGCLLLNMERIKFVAICQGEDPDQSYVSFEFRLLNDFHPLISF